jgi:hypothetical protein
LKTKLRRREEQVEGREEGETRGKRGSAKVEKCKSGKA